MSNTDQATLNRNLTPFKKKGITTANGAADGSTLISINVPALASALAELLGEVDGFWNDAEIYLLSGDMKDQIRQVVSWVQATGVLTVDHPFTNPKVSLLSANVGIGAVVIPVVSTALFSPGEARIWDALNAETVLILTVDTVLNQLTIAGPGVVNAYTVLNGAAISMSPRILPGIFFWIMLPNVTVDKGTHTNPEQWLHDHHWDSGQEIVLVAAAAVNLGVAVAVGNMRRVRGILATNNAQANTFIILSQVAPAMNRGRFGVPAQTTRLLGEQDGFSFAAGVQIQISSTAAAAGSETYITAFGVEAPPT